MHITVTTDKLGTYVFPVEVNEDMEMENFIALCQLELPELGELPLCSFSLSHNGRMIVMTSTSLKKTFKDLGINDNDIVMITAAPRPSGSKQPARVAVDASKSGSGSGANTQQLIANLIKSIKVPTASTSASTSHIPGLKKAQIDQLRLLFNACKADAVRRAEIRRFSAGFGDAVEKDDFDAFCRCYIASREEAIARERAMMDPTSAEGQRLIAEQIERENIDFSHQFAMEHMPEAYVPVTMLYIKMKINGIEVKAFVDSGAQVSILSEETAKRCNLMRLVDKRFKTTVHGVGGTQQLLGKIHTCQVQIESQYFTCNFDVLSNHSIDLLLGLDILRRHQCSIDLKNNCLKFGDTASTPFLSDADAPRRDFEAAGASSESVAADSAKLASLMALGFEEEAARAMLIQCGNDLEMAASNLLARQTAKS